MNAREQNVCFIAGGKPGPIVTLDHGDRVFSVEFGDHTQAFFDNPLVSAEGPTIGELNRKWLHGRLDSFIDEMLKEAA